MYNNINESANSELEPHANTKTKIQLSLTSRFEDIIIF